MTFSPWKYVLRTLHTPSLYVTFPAVYSISQPQSLLTVTKYPGDGPRRDIDRVFLYPYTIRSLSPPLSPAFSPSRSPASPLLFSDTNSTDVAPRLHAKRSHRQPYHGSSSVRELSKAPAFKIDAACPDLSPCLDGPSSLSLTEHRLFTYVKHGGLCSF